MLLPILLLLAQDAPLRRPPMRRPEPTIVSPPSRQAAIAKALIAPDPHDLMVLLGLPDSWPDRDPVLMAAQPPQPIVPTAQPSNRSPASLAQPQPGPVLVANPDAVLVTVSPMSKGASERILGKRLGKIAAVWLVTMENTGLEPVMIAPSAIYRRISQLEPYDHASMAILTDEGVKNGLLARTGRVADDTGKLLAFAIASNAIKIAESWPGALVTGAVWAIPQFIQRLKGAETPVSANVERLGWIAPVQIGPGESATAHIWTSQWDSPSPVSFSLDVSRVALRKSIQ